MKNLMFADATLAELIRDFIKNCKVLIKEELQLASREMSEKFSCYGRNAVILLIGGFIAYAGSIVLIGGLGLLAGLGFQKLGLTRLLAAFVGVGAVGMLVVLTGLVFVLKGRNAIAGGSLAPKKTIDTIKHLKNSHESKAPRPIPKEIAHPPKRSAEEIQMGVLRMEDRINLELKEMAYRATPAGMKDRTTEHMKAHPYVWTTAAFAGALICTALVVRKLRKPNWGSEKVVRFRHARPYFSPFFASRRRPFKVAA